MMKPMLKQTLAALGLALPLAVTGCNATSGPKQPDATHTRALIEAQSSDLSRPLAYYEQRWKASQNDVYAAINYSRALRQAGDAQRALTVMAGHAKKPDAPVDALVEFAAASASAGKFDSALHYAQKAVDANPDHPKANMVYGIALDATGEHTKAETAYRHALKYWEGDPSILLSNLALSLANQGFLDQALNTIREAHSLAPEREEIARNVEILTKLHHNVTKHSSRDPEKFK